MKTIFRIVLISLCLLSSPFLSEGQNMTNYCQLPTSLENTIDPNVLFAIDKSGSMSWCAYTGRFCDTVTYPYDGPPTGTTTYEGYFDPEKYYKLDLTDNVYYEYTPTGITCTTTCAATECKNNTLGNPSCVTDSTCSPKTYRCCKSYIQTGDCNVDSGNYLNYLHMRRVDVLRWALTGGRPESCSGTVKSCDPEAYLDPPHSLSCTNNGCILLSQDGTKVQARWERLTGIEPTTGLPYNRTDPATNLPYVNPATGLPWVVNPGLLFQLKYFDPKPLIGTMFFSGQGVTRTVSVGDFTGSASFDAANPYKNVIEAVNNESPINSTPTAPALWDVYNYFAQNTPEYGGPAPQTGVGNEWKNPLNRCFETSGDGICQGNEFEFVPCAKNFVVLITDGQWNTGGTPGSVKVTCDIDDPSLTDSPDPVVPAYQMHKTGFTNSASVKPVTTSIESVYGVGLWLGGTGELALKNIAMYGSFKSQDTWPGGTSDYPHGTCFPDDCGGLAGEGSSCTALPTGSHSDWDSRNNSTGSNIPDGIPDTFFAASDASKIKEKIAEVILDILRHVASGSALSILSSNEGSGANLLQAVYYPKKAFGTTEIDWTGQMQNLWYFVDPYFSTSSIREDTDLNNILNLGSDYTLSFLYDTDGKTKAKRYSTDVYGKNETYVDTIALENIKNLWEAGKILFERTSASPRKIYTTTDGSTRRDFSTAQATTLRQYLQAATDTEAADIIDYIRGTDKTGYRNRTVTIGATTAEWRLGDIVNSTPRQQSSAPANYYYKKPPDGYSDATYLAYTQTSDYKNRGMSYIGANDGMLHAFKHGKLEQSWTGKGSTDQARLSNPDVTSPLGSEVWAFVPKNALPYLKYLADKDYCHLYYVDGTATIADASIVGNETDPKTVSSWKTILIGSMGLGGANKISTDSCTTGAAGTCVKTPATDPVDSTKGLGYSSYFALDITDTGNPQVLWEFSDPDLGFSTSGPAIVRIGDANKNGKWLVVFASGPTGPIDADRQFLGKSYQPLKLFVLDLKTGTLLRTIDTSITISSTEAFGGSLFNSTIDTDRWSTTKSGVYSDDAFYLGYTKKHTDGTWTKGGVLRVVTKEDPAPSTWVASTVIDGIGPVTSAVSKLQDTTNGDLWLYFGTGRFFYRSTTTVDDANGQQAIYGIKEPCYVGSTINDIDYTCTSPGSADVDKSTSASNSVPSHGWWIDLAPSLTTGTIQTGAERVVTDPYAVSFGAVFFTTFVPSTGICASGGDTAIWAVKYNSGGSMVISGIALTQVSTGAIHELDLSKVFTERGGRRSPGITGMPPKGQGLSLLVGPKPIRKILHMKEK